MEMTPRQRWLALLNREQPDRIPTDYWATGEVSERLKKDLGCADDEALSRKLHIDRVAWAGAKALVWNHPSDPKANIWGVRHQPVNYGTGVYNEVASHPLGQMQSVEEIHAFQWPSPDNYDYSTVMEGIERNDGYRAIQAGGYEPFLLYCEMRGLEQAFEDLLVNPEIAEAALGHIFDFHYEHNRRLFEAGKGKIDLTYVAEDLGSQTGPLMSLENYRRFLLPNQKKMADLAHSYGVHVFYHTDGAARIFIPDLINVVGIEVLNPIQWRCPTMDRESLVRDFGRKIGFHGGIDNQQTLPFGTVDDVVKEVRESIEIFKGSRWICAPCHNLQPVTPTANVVAMYETIYKYGKL